MRTQVSELDLYPSSQLQKSLNLAAKGVMPVLLNGQKLYEQGQGGHKVGEKIP